MMNSNTLFFKRHRSWAAGWLLTCITLAVALVMLLPHAAINSSVLSLLPNQIMGKLPAALQNGFVQRLDRQLVWMVSPGKDADDAVAAAWVHELQSMQVLAEVKGQMTAQEQQAWGKFFFEHRNGLIDPQTRARLDDGGQLQADWVLSQVYSAFSGVSSKELENDPLMLVRGAQLALQQNTTHLKMRQGWLVAEDEAGRQWYFIRGELNHSSYDTQKTAQIVSELASAQTRLRAQWPDAQVLSRGTLFYSDYASQQAKRDVSTLGVATIAGVLLLIYLVFRSLRPLVLSILSVVIGAMAGTVTTLLVFGELHLMTLVMSISIVGISVDYTLYYLTERMVHGTEMTPLESLRKVFDALLLALGTAVIAYVIMMLAPFPGIRQLALFAATGLTAACMTVICWHPYLVKHLPVRPIPGMIPMARWLAAWRRQRRLRVGLPLAFAVVTLIGLFFLRIDDDIAQLQGLPKDIHHQEQLITGMTGQGMEQKWFVVYGDTPQATLERLEAIVPELEKAKSQSWIAQYRVFPLASLQRQAQDVTLLKAASQAVTGRLAEVGIHVRQPVIDAMPVSVDTWLGSVTSEGWRLLWLTLPDGQSGVLVPVDGVQDTAALAALARDIPGLAWVDRKGAFDQMFAFYRTMLGWLLSVAVVVIAVSYMIRLGWRRGVLNVVPSVLSLGTSLAVLALSGHVMNLFSLLAMVLVLGVGINYTLFFNNPRGTPLTSMLAITLAMVTTLLTQGMLVFSSTEAISSFGIVLCSGIFTAFVLSPLVLPTAREKRT